MSDRETLSRGRLIGEAIKRLRSRYLVLSLVLGLSTMAIVFGASVSSYATGQSASGSAATSALRQIQFYPDTRVITDGTISDLAEQPHVDWVVPFVRVIGLIGETGEDISVIGVTVESVPPNLLNGDFGQDDGGNWIVLPSTVGGHTYDDIIGGSIELTFTVAVDGVSGYTRDDAFIVTGVADPSYQVDAPNAAYVSLQTATKLYKERNGLTDEISLAAFGGYEKATLQVDDQANVDGVLADLQAHGFRAVSQLQMLDQVPGVIAIIRLVTVVISVVLLIICVMVTVLLVSSLVRQRNREIGILRATGWPPALIWRTWLTEVLLVAFGSVVLGTALGASMTALGGNWLRSQIAHGSLEPINYSWWALTGPAVIVLASVAITASVSIKASSRFDVSSLMRVF